MLNTQIPTRAVAVTPSATTNQSGSALYVGGVGNVNLLTEGGDNIVFTAVPAGTTLIIGFAKVLAALTTATLMVRMF